MLKYLAAVIVLVFGFLSPHPAAAVDMGELRVSLLEGDVQTRPADTDEWVPASVNIPVLEGDSIWVPEGGKLEIQTRGGAYIRLNEGTALDVVRVEDDATQLYVPDGHVFVNNQRRKGDVIQVDTAAASVRSYDTAIFRVEVREGRGTEVWVYRGTAYAEGKGGKTRVPAGRILSIGDDGSTDLYALESTDAWERWNLARDQELGEHLYSSNYLPDELDVYARDFDVNGRWVNVNEYGYVWTPTAIISAGWSPYRSGRWVWRGGDYVWVSYEPWGWAPYHYGRWAFVASVGWCWVPPVRGSVYWGPGYVGWVHTPTTVAWVPLAPGEIYYGHGYYGPHSVNIVNVNVRNIVPGNYRHVNVRNAVTTVDNDFFFRGRSRGSTPYLRDNPFLSSGVNIGRPEVRRERSIFTPVFKDVPRANLPPANLRTAPGTRFRELREARPVVKQPMGSVFTRGSAGRTVAPPVSRSVTPGSGITREKKQAPERKLFAPQQYRSTDDSGKERGGATVQPRTTVPRATTPPAAEPFKGRKEMSAPSKTTPRATAPPAAEPFKGRKEMSAPSKTAPAPRVATPPAATPFKGKGEVTAPARSAPTPRAATPAPSKAAPAAREKGVKKDEDKEKVDEQKGVGRRGSAH